VGWHEKWDLRGGGWHRVSLGSIKTYRAFGLKKVQKQTARNCKNLRVNREFLRGSSRGFKFRFEAVPFHILSAKTGLFPLPRRAKIPTAGRPKVETENMKSRKAGSQQPPPLVRVVDFPGQYSVPVLRCPYQVITALIHDVRRLLPLRHLVLSY
jgi:hypothetical protein